MALIGTYETSKANIDEKFPRSMVLTISATQNLANNTSTVSWTLKAGDSVGAIENRVKFNHIHLYINGENTYIDDRYGNNAPGYYRHDEIASGTQVIQHNLDGTKTISIYMEAGIYNWSINSSYSGNLVLDKIPRKATITSAPNFNDEQNPTIIINNSAGNSVSSLQTCIASADGTTIYVPYQNITPTDTSFTFNLSETERNTLRQAAVKNTLTITFYLKTVIGGNTYYDIVTRTLSIINANPTLNPTVEDTNDLIIGLTGSSKKLILGYSDAKATVNASAKKYATIVNRTIINERYTINQNSYIFNKTQNNQFKFSAEDSRGNKSSQTITSPVVGYIPLSCKVESRAVLSTAQKINANVKLSGSYFNGSFGKVDNTLNLWYRFKYDDVDWCTWRPLENITVSGDKYSCEFVINDFDYDSTITIQGAAADKIHNNDTPYGEVNTEERVVKYLPVFDWGKDNFNFNVPVYMNNKLMNYIVKEGLSEDGWWYRKWADGTAEVWGFSLIRDGNATNPWGSCYYSTPTPAFYYPFNFVEPPKEFVSVDATNDILVYKSNIQNTEQHSGAYGLFSPASVSGVQGRFYYYIIGKYNTTQEAMSNDSSK